LVLRRVRQWPFVLDHLAQIAAVDPTVARRAADEIIGLVLWRIADANAVTDPFELTDTIGLRVRIPAPPGQ